MTGYFEKYEFHLTFTRLYFLTDSQGPSEVPTDSRPEQTIFSHLMCLPTYSLTEEQNCWEAPAEVLFEVDEFVKTFKDLDTLKVGPTIEPAGPGAFAAEDLSKAVSNKPLILSFAAGEYLLFVIREYEFRPTVSRSTKSTMIRCWKRMLSAKFGRKRPHNNLTLRRRKGPTHACTHAPRKNH